jgi:predicted dehydrogenase
VTAINTNIRYYPLCLELRQRVRAGEFGSITQIVGSYLQDWLLEDTDFNWRVLQSEGGPLRAVADIGTHWIDLVCFITDLEVEEVCADLATVYPTRYAPRGSGSVETFTGGTVDRNSREPISVDTEDLGSVLIRFVGGARACLSVSQMMAGRKNCLRFDLAGTRASAAWNSEVPNQLQIGYRNQANALLLRDPSLLHDSVRPFANYPGGHAEGFPDSHKQLFRAFYERIATGKPGAIPLPSFADGHRVMRICDAIRASSRNHAWVRV